MPIRLIREGDGGVIFKGSGVVEAEDALSTEAEIYSTDEKIRKIPYQLIDMSEVTEFNLSTADMRRLAEDDNRAFEINPTMRIAIVASDPHAFGMNRMYQAYVRDAQKRVKVFKDLRVAKAWLRNNEHPSAR